MELTYAVQYQVSQSIWFRAVGSCAAFRAKSLSGVVSALTSIEEINPLLPKSHCASERFMYTHSSSSPPASKMPATVNAQFLFCQFCTESVSVSPTCKPCFCASSEPTITHMGTRSFLASAVSVSLASSSESQSPVTVHHFFIATMPVSSSSPVGSAR